MIEVETKKEGNKTIVTLGDTFKIGISNSTDNPVEHQRNIFQAINKVEDVIWINPNFFVLFKGE